MNTLAQLDYLLMHKVLKTANKAGGHIKIRDIYGKVKPNDYGKYELPSDMKNNDCIYDVSDKSSVAIRYMLTNGYNEHMYDFAFKSIYTKDGTCLMRFITADNKLYSDAELEKVHGIKIVDVRQPLMNSYDDPIIWVFELQF